MNHRPKILYVITKSNWGGAQRYLFDLATSLPVNEFEVVVALGGTGEKKAGAGVLEKNIREAGVRTIFIRSLIRNISPIQELKSFWELVRLLKTERPDVIHLNSSKAVTMGALAGRVAGVPKIISTVHGWAFNEPRPLWQRTLLKGIHWIGVTLSHKTITVSLYDFNQAALWPLVRGKIVHIHNGISPYKPEQKAIARKHFSDLVPELSVYTNALWIGTNSELHKNKGLDFLLTAFANIHIDHPQTIVVIVGSGEERKNLEALACELGIATKVFLLGFIENARNYLQAFDIHTLTSRKEGLPYALLEAGCAGLPVVASKVGGIPEIIDSGIQGLLTPVGDTGVLSRALADLIEAPALREEYGKNLQHKIRDDFSMEEMIGRTKALYRRTS